MMEFRTLFAVSREPPIVLITGGAGFIGHHLTRRLLELGARVIVFDDFSTGLRKNVAPSDRVQIVEGNVLDRETLASVAKDVDLVLHLAAVVGMRRVYDDPEYALRVSDEGTGNVLAATGSQPVLLMSSSAVYGLQSCELAAETDAISYASILKYDGGRPGYACGKWLLERHGQAAMAAGRPVIIVRPFNVVGAGQREDFGMVLPRFVQRARNGTPLQVHDDGNQVRSFGDVRTFIECIIRLLHTRDAWRPESTPVNIGTSVTTSMLTLAQIVLEETGSDSRLEFVPYQTVFPGNHDVRRRRPDNARLNGLIGDVGWRELRSVVREFVAASPAT